MSKSYSDVTRVYIFLFKLYGIYLECDDDSKKSKWSRWICKIWGMVIVVTEFLCIAQVLFVFADLMKRHETGSTIMNLRFVYLLYSFNVCGTILIHIYVYFAAHLVPTGQLFHFLLHSNIGKASLKGNVKLFISVKNWLTALHVIVCIVSSMFTPMLIIMNDDSSSKYWQYLIFPFAPLVFLVPYLFYSFQFNCCILFTIVVKQLTEHLMALVDVPLTSSEFIAKYDKLYEFARKFNSVMSPPLLVIGIVNIMSIPTAVKIIPTNWGVHICSYMCFPMSNIFVYFVICVLIMNQCNQNRLSILRLCGTSILNVSYYTVKGLKRGIHAQCWLIETLLSGEDFFDLGCYIPIDEGLVIMIFQFIYDNTMALQDKYQFDDDIDLNFGDDFFHSI